MNGGEYPSAVKHGEAGLASEGLDTTPFGVWFFILWYNPNMDFQVLTIVLVVLGFGLVIYFLARRPKTDQGMQLMQSWIQEVKTELRTSLQDNQVRTDSNAKAFNERLDKAAMVISSLTKELGQMQELGRSIKEVQDFLNPKLRGNIGEEILEEMLRQALPNTMYSFQYRFRSGDTVDAVVKLQNELLPIDSKFSLENYKSYLDATTQELRDMARKEFFKDVKKRVDEISKKYILPSEKTTDYAIMYVPSEAVAAEIYNEHSLYEYCRQKKVVPAGPNNLYVTLKSIMIGLHGQQLNEQVKVVLQMIQGLKQDSEKFSKNMGVLAKHVKDASNTMDVISTDYGKIHGKIDQVANLRIESTSAGGRAEDKLLE